MQTIPHDLQFILFMWSSYLIVAVGLLVRFRRNRWPLLPSIAISFGWPIVLIGILLL